MNWKRRFTARSKFDVLAAELRDARGRLLDVGARDRCLLKYLNTTGITYLSADMVTGHDYQLDLEQLLPISNNEFDFVVALDVLEHLENIHQAFAELARITKGTLVVALPNMGTLPRRWSFLRSGWLGTGKYDLLTKHQGDRHRWLTVYNQMNSFIEENAKVGGLNVEFVVEEIEDMRRPFRFLGLFLGRLGLPFRALFTARCIYFLKKPTVDPH